MIRSGQNGPLRRAHIIYRSCTSDEPPKLEIRRSVWGVWAKKQAADDAQEGRQIARDSQATVFHCRRGRQAFLEGGRPWPMNRPTPTQRTFSWRLIGLVLVRGAIIEVGLGWVGVGSMILVGPRTSLSSSLTCNGSHKRGLG